MRKIVFAAGLLLASICSEAQKLSIENVHKVTLRNSDAIKEGSEVKGYYFFYVSDKIDKRTNEYTLQITDNNLVKLKDIKFQDSKHVTILESSFNGTDLIFLLYNDDARTFSFHRVQSFIIVLFIFRGQIGMLQVSFFLFGQLPVIRILLFTIGTIHLVFECSCIIIVQ